MSNSNERSNSLQALFMEQSRRNPDDPYAWGMARRTRAGRPLQHLPALEDIARDQHPLVVIQKSAQVGISELMVTRALHAAISVRGERGVVLYLMPTGNQMEDFVHGRVDPAIQDSAYLRGLLQPEPPRRKGADSVRMKRLGDGTIYFRAVESERQIATVDADLVILDEFDQMSPDVLVRARSRIASSRAGQLIVASTPKYPDAGINALWQQSDQRHYYLPCPKCGLEQPLTWDDNVDRDHARIICRVCWAPMNRLARGRWVAEAPGNGASHGYHHSRLYSPWVNLADMIEASTSASYADIQRFLNDDLGEVFTPPNGSLSPNDLDRCAREFDQRQYIGEPCVMGVDVGKRMHVIIRGADSQRLWFAGDVEWEALPGLAQHYHVRATVIDSNPETYQAARFATENPSAFVSLAHYDRKNGKFEREAGYPQNIHVDRTAIIDETFQRIREQVVSMPANARELGGHVKDGYGEYYRQMTAMKRTIDLETETARWENGSRADHYAHAEVYAYIAMKLQPEPWFDVEDWQGPGPRTGFMYPSYDGDNHGAWPTVF